MVNDDVDGMTYFLRRTRRKGRAREDKDDDDNGQDGEDAGKEADGGGWESFLVVGGLVFSSSKNSC